MRRARSISVWLLAVAVTLAPSAVLAPAAAGAPSAVGVAGISDCNGDYLCIWEHIHYGGTMGAYSKLPDGRCYSMGVMNNMTSSLYNKGYPSRLRVYDTGNCTGVYYEFPLIGGSNDLRVIGWNDRISSFMWV